MEHFCYIDTPVLQIRSYCRRILGFGIWALGFGIYLRGRAIDAHDGATGGPAQKRSLDKRIDHQP